MNAEEKVISIVGFGNIGKLICALLLPYRDHQFRINIVDVDESVEGALIDFKHGNELYPNHSIVYNDEVAFNASDYIFHCAGASVPKGKSRLYTCQQSIEITEAVFQGFNPVKVPFIIVVANPVDIISTITHKLTGLPVSHVIGTGTFLDSIRMNQIVKEQNNDLSSIDTVLLGEHGASVFLSHQLSTVNGKQFSEVFKEETISSYLARMKSAAAEIKRTQDATIYGVSYCAISIFESLLLDNAQNQPVCTAIPNYLNKELGGSSMFVSLYSRIDAN